MLHLIGILWELIRVKFEFTKVRAWMKKKNSSSSYKCFVLIVFKNWSEQMARLSQAKNNSERLVRDAQQKPSSLQR